MQNALSFDIEDYYQIVARDWLGVDLPVSNRVLLNTLEILDILNKENIKATFFVVGKVAEAFPELVQEICYQGHELGLHGYSHRLVSKLKVEAFEQEISSNIKAIESACGVTPRCHRAPAFSLGLDNRDALEVLARQGIEFDSSMFPFSGRRYGSNNIPRTPFRLPVNTDQELWEIVLPTLDWNGKRLPIGGGGYLRAFPFRFTKRAIEKINQEGVPATIYFHSYEVDQYHPKYLNLGSQSFNQKLKFHIKNHLQHVNRISCKEKLLKLVEQFEFTTCGSVLDTWKSKPTTESAVGWISTVGA